MGIPAIENEKQLLGQIAQGDKRAFEKLFHHYHGYVASFSRKITRSQDLAEEIVQDIFLKLWLGREKLSSIDNFGAYLNTLIRNHCFSTLRQLSQETKSNIEFRSRHTEIDQHTQQQLDYREAETILSQAIDQLSPQQKTVYQLCHQQGLRYDQAAEQMGISPQTVHSYMKEALKKIRLHFKDNALGYTLFMSCLFK